MCFSLLDNKFRRGIKEVVVTLLSVYLSHMGGTVSDGSVFALEHANKPLGLKGLDVFPPFHVKVNAVMVYQFGMSPVPSCPGSLHCASKSCGMVL